MITWPCFVALEVLIETLRGIGLGPLGLDLCSIMAAVRADRSCCLSMVGGFVGVGWGRLSFDFNILLVYDDIMRSWKMGSKVSNIYASFMGT